MNPEYECPKCTEWITILPTTPAVFDCPWCGEPLTVDADGEFVNGMHRDKSRLISALPHIKRMVKFAKDYEPEQKYGTAHGFQEHKRHGGTRDDY